MLEPSDARLNALLRASLDAEHEKRIAEALADWHAATTPTRARKAYNLFRKLVAMRSPEMVRKLEVERGLARVRECGRLRSTANGHQPEM